MTFLNPILAVIGLACVALPIIIHILMRKRRRPIPWGAMRFLIEAYRQQRRRLNLEQILLLARRCLLVALVALAIGKPILQAAGAFGQRGPRTLYLLIDNSLASSAAEAGKTSALVAHRDAALKLLGELDQAQGDRVAVISLGAPADPLVLPATADLAGAAAFVREMNSTDSRCDLAGALSRLRDVRGGEDYRRDEGSAYVAILSEFRVGSADIEQSLSSLSGAVQGARLVASRPAIKGLSNVAIFELTPLESVIVSSTSGEERTPLPVRVSLKRSGEDLGRATMSKVKVEALPTGARTGTARAIEKTVSWKAGEESTTASVTLDLAASEVGGHGSSIILRASVDRDSIPGDGVTLRPMDVRDRLAVCVLAPPAPMGAGIQQFTPAKWLTLAIAPSDDGSLRTRRLGDIAITRLDPGRDLSPTGEASAASLGPLAGFDAIVICEPHLLDAGAWRRIRAAADAGVAIVVFPSPGESTQTWGDQFASSLGLDVVVSREATEHESPLRIVPPSGGDQSRLLAMLSGEIEELAKPVTINRTLGVEVRSGSMTPALSLSNGAPLVLVASGGSMGPQATGSNRPNPTRGVIIVVTAPMDLAWTDLPARPFMVPFIQEMLRQGVGLATSGGVGVAGQPVALPPGTTEMVPMQLGPEEGFDAAPIPVDAQRGPATSLRRSGVWRARGAEGASLAIVALQADVAGSRVDVRSEAEISSWLSPLGGEFQWIDTADPTTSARSEQQGVLSSGPQKPPISFPLLVVAFLVAAAEVVMARVFSHARVDETFVAPAQEGRSAA